MPNSTRQLQAGIVSAKLANTLEVRWTAHMTPEMVEAQKYCADRDVEGKKAQYAVPAKHETIRACVNSTWVVAIAVVCIIGVLEYLKVESGIIYAALAVLGALEGVRRWRK
jgi:hypothetical protein